MKPIETITEEVWQEFGNRKRKGRIDFVIDTATGGAFAVPKTMEHKDFIPTLPGFSPKASRFVPSQLRLEGGEVREIIVGASSYEVAMGVAHTPKEIADAYRATWELLGRNNFPVNVQQTKLLKEFVHYRT